MGKIPEQIYETNNGNLGSDEGFPIREDAFDLDDNDKIVLIEKNVPYFGSYFARRPQVQERMLLQMWEEL